MFTEEQFSVEQIAYLNWLDGIAQQIVDVKMDNILEEDEASNDERDTLLDSVDDDETMRDDLEERLFETGEMIDRQNWEWKTDWDLIE